MMKKIILCLSMLLLLTNIYAEKFELPKVTGRIIKRDFYTLMYNEKFEQADWVAYELTAEEAQGSINRSNSFKSDPLVTTGSASLNDYKGSGFDRGHLAPAADMKLTKKSMSDSFYLSNMSPQRSDFNSGSWKNLEKLVHTWAENYGYIYIATGPIFTDTAHIYIGENHVAVPEYFYKVILVNSEYKPKAIGFILPNQKSTLPLKYFAYSIDYVEEITGIDFFYLFNETYGEVFETTLDIEKWNFNP